MKTTIDVEGVTCFVPSRWPKYTESQKVAVCKMVQRLKAAHGDLLGTVHVDRLVWEGGLRQRWRIDGGYSTKPSLNVRTGMTLTERIDHIDRLLFDAGVLVLGAKTNAARTAADHKITEARVELDKLRSRVEC